MAKRMETKRRRRRLGRQETTDVQQLSLWGTIRDSMTSAFGGGGGRNRGKGHTRQAPPSIQWLSADSSWLMNFGSALDLGGTSEIQTQLPIQQAIYYALRSDHMTIALDAHRARAHFAEMLQRQVS